MVAPIRARNGGTTDNDYLLVPFSKDDGKGQGGLRFLDISNMTGTLSGKSPAVAGQRVDNDDIREIHGMGFTEMFGDDWKTVVMPSTEGFLVYDFDDISAVSQKAHYRIMSSSSGGAGSAAKCSGTCDDSYNAAPSSGNYYNYDHGVTWHLAVAAPYIYTANAENGLNVYKWGSTPGSITWVKRYDTSYFGHQRVSQVWAFGRVMVVGSVEVGSMFTVLDISDPANPVKKYTMLSGNGAERVYGLTLNGYRIYGAGKDDNTSNGGTNNIQIYDITFDSNNVPNGITKKASKASNICGEGAYISVQDGFIHGGYSECYEKWNASNPSSLTEVSPSNATLGINGADLDFVTHFNNMVFLGNDHEGSESGSLILCHGSPDTTPPAINAVSPRDGSANVPVTSMIGLSFTDQLRMSTITSSNVTLRKQGSATAIAGHYSYWLNLLNFAPASPLEPGTTYEIVVGSGLKDLAGNSAASAVYDFTTAGGGGGTGQAPFGGTPWAIPGTIEAEDYDTGGQGVAYSDTTSGNASNTYRADDVDVASCGSGCFFIGTAAPGEWTEYTVNVTSAGTRTLQVRVAATAARTIHLEMDGTTIATFTVPNTGSYSTYTTLSTNVTLTAGQKVMKVVFDSGSANLDKVTFQ